MADTKITALTALTAADPANDVIPIVDVSDTSMAASGTTKKISVNNILGASGTATLASATITGAATVGTTLGVTGVATFAAGTVSLPALTTTGDTNTGIYYPAADTFAVTTGGTERYRVDSTGLGIGVAPTLGFNVLKPSDTAFTNLPVNANFADSTPMAAGVGGGIAFSGRYDGTSSVSTYGIISGVKENGTATNFAGALVFGTRDAGGNVNIERLRINSTGNIVMKNANTGIDFSINSEAAGMTSELLNDYEEGTWTGTLAGGTTNPTVPVTATGRYTKIGRQVYVQIIFGSANTTGASGAVSITGLPFANNASIASQGSILSDNTLTFTGSPFVFVDLSASTLLIYQSTSNAAASACTHNAGTPRYLYANLTYTVA